MKNGWKALFLTCIALLTVFGFNSQAQAADKIEITVNLLQDNENIVSEDPANMEVNLVPIYPSSQKYLKTGIINTDVAPIIENGRLLVPIRAIADELEFDVNYINNQIELKKDDKTIDLKVGDNNAYVNGQNVILDVPAQIYQGRTMVPLRFISQAFDYKVFYDSDLNTAFITYETMLDDIFFYNCDLDTTDFTVDNHGIGTSCYLKPNRSFHNIYLGESWDNIKKNYPSPHCFCIGTSDDLFYDANVYVGDDPSEAIKDNCSATFSNI